MRLTPRADEVAHVAAILDAEHASAMAAAKVVIKEVAEMLWLRDWYLLAAAWIEEDGGHTVFFGPYSSEAEARSWAGTFGKDGWMLQVLPMRGLGKPEERKSGGFGYCCTDGCGHPPWAHLFSGSSRGKCLICKTCDSFESSKPKGKPRRRAG